MAKLFLPAFVFCLFAAFAGIGYAVGRMDANDDWFRWVDDKIMPIVASCDLPAPTLPE